MTEQSVVRRYARALFSTAQADGVVEVVESDLDGIDQVIRQNPDLGKVLRAPTIAGARKRQLLQTAFQGQVHELTLRFLLLVIDRGREGILTEISADYRRLANQLRGLLPVEVTSAVPLEPDEISRLTAALSQRTGKQAVLTTEVDPSILGGVVVRMEDTIIDGSVRGKLSQLRALLSAGRG